ncbi:hypothetical protein ACKVEX_14910 [Rhodocyclaceae bacterium SMB388]
MSQTDRIVRIRALLVERRAVSKAALRELLEVSSATLKRDIAFLRDNTMNTRIFNANGHSEARKTSRGAGTGRVAAPSSARYRMDGG